jgi:Serine carboxypeptidase
MFRALLWHEFYRQYDTQGGPGCSAFDGLMMEVGPWVMDSDGVSLRTREGGWEEYTTMVYSPSSVCMRGISSKNLRLQLTNLPGLVTLIPAQIIMFMNCRR